MHTIAEQPTTAERPVDTAERGDTQVVTDTEERAGGLSGSSTLRDLGFPASADEPLPSAESRKKSNRFDELARFFAADERGAVTAEYALVIMAGVAFAGVLIAIMRSSEVRSMLLDLVQNALGSAG